MEAYEILNASEQRRKKSLCRNESTQGKSLRSIGRALGRSHTTLSCELAILRAEIKYRRLRYE